MFFMTLVTIKDSQLSGRGAVSGWVHSANDAEISVWTCTLLLLFFHSSGLVKVRHEHGTVLEVWSTFEVLKLDIYAAHISRSVHPAH
mmetsp:Transcript_23862/g.31964  ORF Transcript_23862/g.31964 Transcript_23862/m.31964 type:complete len:87 (+) Transcript_23862:2314-2574(+)